MVVACLCFVAVNYLCYAVYLPLDAWWALRFFLPAFPPLFVFMSIAVLRVPALLPLHPRALVPVAARHTRRDAPARIQPPHECARLGGREAIRRDRQVHCRHAAAASGDYFRPAQWQRGVYYSGRLTVRYDRLEPGQLETVVSGFKQRGYSPFILLDVFEREEFTAKFGDAARFGLLDAKAAALVPTVDLYQVN